MKRFILLLAFAAFPLLASAQTEFPGGFIKGGLNMHSITGTDAVTGNDISAAEYMGFGYNVVIGIEKPLGESNSLFYTYEVGFGTRGSWHAEDGSESKMVDHAVQIAVNLVYRIPVAANQSLDIHFGPGWTGDIAGKSVSKVQVMGDTYTSESKLKDYGSDFRRFDIVLTPGVTFWFGQFGIDVTWQKGMMPMTADTDIKASNILFRLAYKF
ncbi:MAG: outer membrane beta-barrel protein [Bacteroidales bacterium]|nr:outer membrane beta-barrel protein [Bacteroidales bacterium]